ncbi:MAG: type II toxin-antitoxin system PemK/MazF family toxin [Actinomycetota bacterium]
MASADDIWLVDFGEPYPAEPAHHRPALVLGPPETFGPRFPFVIVAPLTTTFRGLSLHIEVAATPTTGLNEISYVQCELLRSVNRNRLIHYLGAIDSDTSLGVSSIVRTLLSY